MPPLPPPRPERFKIFERYWEREFPDMIPPFERDANGMYTDEVTRAAFTMWKAAVEATRRYYGIGHNLVDYYK